jgi:competence protein ComEA
MTQACNLPRQMLACLAGVAIAMFAPMACATEVNAANQAELEVVKGIGPALSERILLERRNRHFRDWPDFMARLSGIGPVRAAKLSAAGLRVEGQTWPATVQTEPASTPRLNP